MNTYNLKARIYPVILSLLPIIIIGTLFSIQFQSYYQSLGSLGLTTILFFLFSQIGRDRGKKIENNLWSEWGGAPTTQIFRFSDNTIDSITKKKCHQTMCELVPNEITPSTSEEENSGNFFDEIYQSWTKFLIGKTRDTKKYDLLFNENINYGFRRNTLGLKPFSIVIIIILSIGIWTNNYISNGIINYMDSSTLISQVILLTFLLFWIFIVNKSWVKIPAFGYAERLLETVDDMK
ncbi:hypothetical protein [Tenacibaculum piscium]|uniref:hypothetical protein n=1 Tax=Tenacibaculum piscium TaxID=1458515 RepID=UPI001F365606|nr:hypothetical protein [Tenacibaculum piscium]